MFTIYTYSIIKATSASQPYIRATIIAMWRKRFDIILIFVFFLFSFWLMFHTFGYDAVTSQMRPATTTWSDFGSHLPLIRSFSMGANWPPEYPLFPGEPIRYHFLFYAIVGVLERIGVRIDWALNIPSALGFGFLMVMIYLLAKELFRSRLVGLLSVVFFVFNGTLAFLSFFTKNPFGNGSLTEILTNTRFPSFGPWDGGYVSAFWNLNIYTNQRHLGLSLGLALFAIWMLVKAEHASFRRRLSVGVVNGIIVGLLVFINQAAAATLILFAAWFVLTKSKFRLPILLGSFAAAPLALFYISVARPAGSIEFHPWYLINDPITVTKVITYWVYNLGLHTFLIPIGILLSPKRMKWVAVPLLALFIIPNIFQFSPDMINNHKFFNFFMLIGSMYSAFALVWAARRASRFVALALHTHSYVKLVSYSIILLFNYSIILLLFLLLTFAGAIDFLVIRNDPQGHLNDINANPDIQFFATRTKPRDVVLNSYWFYHPASLAGRSVYSGYAYFTWSYGYDKDKRESIVKAIYGAKDKATACRILTIAHIAYVELSDKNEGYFAVNWDLWNNEFLPAYRNDASGMSVYSVKDNCISL